MDTSFDFDLPFTVTVVKVYCSKMLMNIVNVISIVNVIRLLISAMAR